MPNFCAQCGAKQTPTDQWCAQCGARAADAAAPAAPSAPPFSQMGGPVRFCVLCCVLGAAARAHDAPCGRVCICARARPTRPCLHMRARPGMCEGVVLVPRTLRVHKGLRALVSVAQAVGVPAPHGGGGVAVGHAVPVATPAAPMGAGYQGQTYARPTHPGQLPICRRCGASLASQQTPFFPHHPPQPSCPSILPSFPPLPSPHLERDVRNVLTAPRAG